ITFLTWDDSQDRLAIVSAPGALPRNPLASGLHHAAFSVGSLRELVDQYRHLLKEGISPIRCMNHGVATSMYYRDPDDNEIELTVEAFSTVAELNAWFETGAFDANPVGILLDPEDLCRRVDSGEAETSILRPDPNHAFRLQEYLEKRQ
ncbi:MAG: VOC family protein, partial [Burkholderiaceae bacterium]